ncbi:hypothetical protein [Bradyrhizobium sp. WSM1743]|uniref:hypothetical protein n=1 Tax=Bradyrhizobium sp. WSM1743 TaxID=318996 RepID=UPI0006886213|nr:hypothetical protein [Bradyrhizobium sp. WSM1743]
MRLIKIAQMAVMNVVAHTSVAMLTRWTHGHGISDKVISQLGLSAKATKLNCGYDFLRYIP